jgi:hypothetical protein
MTPSLGRRGALPNPHLRRRAHRGHLTLFPAQERREPLLQDARAQEVTSADCLDRLRSEERLATGAKAVARRTVGARFP